MKDQKKTTKTNLEAYRTYIETQIVTVMAKGLREGKLKEEDLPSIADYVLKTIDKVKNHDGFIGLLSHLSMKWPVFSEIAAFEEGKLKQALQKKAAYDMLKLIQSGEINSATLLAKQVLN